MNKDLAPDYRKMLEGIQLVNVVCSRANYTREASCSEIRDYKKKGFEILRAAFEPGYNIQDDVLEVPVAYKITIKGGKRSLAIFEFQYEVVFSIRDRNVLDSGLEDKEIRDFFIGYQMEKFVWSFLRSALADACSKLGIENVILPMKL
ncbi:hypothetical protein DRQ21_07100 [Candidatus Fermentibacteria bacterium]|nr:MAG: hypothetical protein DRQ21_07100 [Candidatus Fermentibacteria bacterium]